HHHVAGGVLQPGGQGRLVAEVPAQRQVAHPGVGRRQPPQDGEGAVARAVIDIKDLYFMLGLQRVERGAEFGVEGGQDLLLLVRRADEAGLGGGGGHGPALGAREGDRPRAADPCIRAGGGGGAPAAACPPGGAGAASARAVTAV